MKMLLKFTALFLIFLFYSVSYVQTKEDALPPSAEEISKIKKAMPLRAAVKPLKSGKLLVFSDAHEYFHSSIPYCKKALEIMAEKSGAFDAVFCNDLEMFETYNLKNFDAVLLNNSCYDIFLPENFKEMEDNDKKKAELRDIRLKNSLKNFIKEGKGLVVIHAALAAFHNDWSEFANILGAKWDNHPWTANSTVTLKVDDPYHPVAKAFGQSGLTLSDEIYQVKEPYSREIVHVLLSIDTDKTDMTVEGIHRKDNDFAISWVKNYGKGKVFYCALGHQHELYWNTTILQHYLDGIQYVMGDLE